MDGIGYTITITLAIMGGFGWFASNRFEKFEKCLGGFSLFFIFVAGIATSVASLSEMTIEKFEHHSDVVELFEKILPYCYYLIISSFIIMIFYFLLLKILNPED
ncbi:hypothetical protein [Maribacter sp. 2-571]|uniref:hypothetical protein n=1 Tax=Maribacter sp. 2-571 TaxID=3417569 RepID=UPI003D35798F